MKPPCKIAPVKSNKIKKSLVAKITVGNLPALILAGAVLLQGSPAVAEADRAGAGSWAADFASPPVSDQSHTWWHWMNGNVTREGITADLEAMHRVGIHSATIVIVGLDVPPGPVKFLGSDWLGMVKFAAQEADRLGMKIGMGDDAGWSSSGGPWVTPEYSMQMVVESEKQLTGPSHFSGTFPQPETRKGFYRDIDIIAIPTPPEEEITMSSLAPKITGSDPGFDVSRLNKGTISLPLPDAARPEYIQFEFTQPFTVRNVTILENELHVHGEIQVSEDGRDFHTVHPIDLDAVADSQTVNMRPVSSRFFRLVFLRANGRPRELRIARIDLSPAVRIENYRAKAMYEREENSGLMTPPAADVPPDLVIQPAQAIHLTAHLDPAGKLDWQVPPGKWTVLRFGYTTTGVTNHPATPEGTGLECDKLSRPAARFFWNGIMPKLEQTLGPLMGGSFDHILIDSYEVGSQNWTPAFRREFQERRGYDMIPFLPVLTGRVVESPEKSERFLWDFRRTIADLFAENYFDYFEVMSRHAGLKLEVEPYGNGPFEDLRCARDSDRVMGEFWWPGSGSIGSLRLAASVAHTYGKSIVGAEAFTSTHGGWDMCPATMKALGDLAFTCGINSYDFHRYAHQPWLNRYPGMTMGPYGSTLERTNTWWEQSAAWEKYLARCDFLLQKGLFVADLLYADDEGAPTGPPEPQLKPGFAYDSCDQDVLLNRLSVEQGRLTLPDGMSYRALVLPPARHVTPALVRKLQQLADAGATIIGPKPESSPSLAGYPQCDATVKSLADELWDSGKIISGKAPEDVLATLGVKPDFQCDLAIPPLYIHRVAGDLDLYFVSNQRSVDEQADCTFRVAGKVPELWHADTGRIEKAAVYSDEGDCIRVPLHLDPAGSVFVVFRPKTSADDHPVSISRTDAPAASPAADSLVIRNATYGATGGGSLDVTALLNSMVHDGSLTLTVQNARFGEDPAPDMEKELQLDYVLDGREMTQVVDEGATVDLVSPRADFPECALHAREAGGLRLQAWKPGTYVIKLASGKMWNKEVADVAPPLEVAGSWDLTFPPKWGAPPHATFASLISWTDDADAGVKYFSGTATYHKSIQIPAEMLGKNHRLDLDLGDVQVIAQVTLNGKDLGVLWKSPYRVEITSAARTGDNDLEVKVTNLWPNRLIGDEQLPEDCEWNSNGSLKEFPQWFLDGKPSPAGRFTFATWKHWNKDSPLLPSGLIGPVTLLPSVEVDVP